MEDAEVIAAFVHQGARTAFGPSLHLEGDCLFFDGWWQACFRISPQAFALRNEDPPRETDALKQVAAELSTLGMQPVETNPSLLYAITYTEIALGLVQWQVWAADATSADLAIASRAGADAFLGDYGDEFKEADYSAEIGGARRTAGLPPSVILTVGVDEDAARAIQAHMSDCRFETRTFDTIQPEMCGALIPTVVVIDAREQTGKEFVMELRAAACGRFLPVAAVTSDRQVPLGADIALDPGNPTGWVDPIRRLLP
ncbi:MAG TPA: hypothetical protein VHF27_09505 [Acidimicrobiales bacterium]|nr:hypothetical protein [Acidimicrobiales bacterium]